MPNCVCQNQECGKTYFIEDGKQDDGFCSFECWEKVNCGNPEDIPVENFIENL